MNNRTEEELRAAFPGMDREDADDNAAIRDYADCLDGCEVE